MSAVAVSTTAVPVSAGSYNFRSTQNHLRKFWLVVLSEPDVDGWSIAARSVDTPGVFDSVTGWPCISCGADPVSGDESGINYLAWSEYAPLTAIKSGIKPWQRKDQVEIGVKSYSVPFVQDYTLPTSKKIMNSANDLFIPAPEHELYNPVVTVKRARTSFAYSTALSCVGSCNEGGFTLQTYTTSLTIATRSAILRDVKASDQIYTDPATDAETAYCDIMIQFEVKGQYPPDGAKIESLVLNDCGLYHLNAVGGKKIHAVESLPDPSAPTTKTLKDPTTGLDVYVPRSSPVFLNSDGTRYTGTNAAELLTKKLTFQRVPYKTWSFLS